VEPRRVAPSVEDGCSATFRYIILHQVGWRPRCGLQRV
jgi:hypothetical protein